MYVYKVTARVIQIDPVKCLSDLTVRDLGIIIESKMSQLTDKLKELENTLIEKVNKIKTELKNELIEVIENDKKMTNEDIKSIKESLT